MCELCYLIVAAVLTPLPQEPTPTLRDLDAFPPRACAVACYEFSCAYQKSLPTVESVFGGSYPVHDARYFDTRFCVVAWDLLTDAGNDNFPEGRRLDALARLRNHVGRVNYYNGVMPSPAPFQWFEDRTGTPFGGK